jgi:hypothetical protein
MKKLKKVQITEPKQEKEEKKFASTEAKTPQSPFDAFVPRSNMCAGVET